MSARRAKIRGGVPINRDELPSVTDDRGWDDSTAKGIPDYYEVEREKARKRAPSANRRPANADRRGVSASRRPAQPDRRSPQRPGPSAKQRPRRNSKAGMAIQHARQFAAANRSPTPDANRQYTQPATNIEKSERHQHLEKELVHHIEECWRAHDIPEFHRSLYRQKYFQNYHHPNVLLQEADNLAHRVSHVQDVMTAVEHRENCLSQLRVLEKAFNHETVQGEMAKALKAALSGLREASVEVVETIVRWRHTIMPKQAKFVPEWTVNNRNYLLAMKDDTPFLEHSFKGVYTGSSTGDPFLTGDGMTPLDLKSKKRRTAATDFLPMTNDMRERVACVKEVLFEEVKRKQMLDEGKELPVFQESMPVPDRPKKMRNPIQPNRLQSSPTRSPARAKSAMVRPKANYPARGKSPATATPTRPKSGPANRVSRRSPPGSRRNSVPKSSPPANGEIPSYMRPRKGSKEHCYVQSPDRCTHSVPRRPDQASETLPPPPKAKASPAQPVGIAPSPVATAAAPIGSPAPVMNAVAPPVGLAPPAGGIAPPAGVGIGIAAPPGGTTAGLQTVAREPTEPMDSIDDFDIPPATYSDRFEDIPPATYSDRFESNTEDDAAPATLDKQTIEATIDRVIPDDAMRAIPDDQQSSSSIVSMDREVAPSAQATEVKPETTPVELVKFTLKPATSIIPASEIEEFLEGYSELLDPVLAKSYASTEDLLQRKQGGPQALEWLFAFEEGGDSRTPDGLVVYRLHRASSGAMGQLLHLTVQGPDYLKRLPGLLAATEHHMMSTLPILSIRASLVYQDLASGAFNVEPTIQNVYVDRKFKWFQLTNDSAGKRVVVMNRSRYEEIDPEPSEETMGVSVSVAMVVPLTPGVTFEGEVKQNAFSGNRLILADMIRSKHLAVDEEKCSAQTDSLITISNRMKKASLHSPHVNIGKVANVEDAISQPMDVCDVIWYCDPWHAAAEVTKLSNRNPDAPFLIGCLNVKVDWESCYQAKNGVSVVVDGVGKSDVLDGPIWFLATHSAGVFVVILPFTNVEHEDLAAFYQDALKTVKKDDLNKEEEEERLIIPSCTMEHLHRCSTFTGLHPKDQEPTDEFIPVLEMSRAVLSAGRVPPGALPPAECKETVLKAPFVFAICHEDLEDYDVPLYLGIAREIDSYHVI